MQTANTVNRMIIINRLSDQKNDISQVPTERRFLWRTARDNISRLSVN